MLVKKFYYHKSVILDTTSFTENFMQQNDISYFYLDLPWLPLLWPMRICGDGTGSVGEGGVERGKILPPAYESYRSKFDYHTFLFDPSGVPSRGEDLSMWALRNTRSLHVNPTPKQSWILDSALLDIFHTYPSSTDLIVLDGPPKEDLEGMANLVTKINSKPPEHRYFVYRNNRLSDPIIFEKSILQRWPEMQLYWPKFFFKATFLTEQVKAPFLGVTSDGSYGDREILHAKTLLEEYRRRYDLAPLV